MTGGQAPYIAKLRRDNDIETPVRHGQFALLPQAAERRPGGYRIGPQSADRLFGAEAVSPPCDQIRYEFRCTHGLPSQMHCSGKVTHFVTLVEQYLPPASRNPAATDGEVHGRAFGRAISGMTANKTLLARQRGRSLRTTFPRPLKQ